MDELDQLIAALGCENYPQAMASATRHNAFLEDARQQTGAANAVETLTALRGCMSIVKRLEAATGKSGVDALAQVEAFRVGSERAEKVEGEMRSMQKTSEDRESVTLIDKAVAQGELLPAKREQAESFYANFGLSGLKTFLQSLPPSGLRPKGNASDGPNQPPPRRKEPNMEDTDDLTVDEQRVGKAMRKSKNFSLEAKKLWEETGGVMDDAHVEELDKKQLEQHRERAAKGA